LIQKRIELDSNPHRIRLKLKAHSSRIRLKLKDWEKGFRAGNGRKTDRLLTIFDKPDKFLQQAAVGMATGGDPIEAYKQAESPCRKPISPYVPIFRRRNNFVRDRGICSSQRRLRRQYPYLQSNGPPLAAR
jgi:hypothetical protein